MIRNAAPRALLRTARKPCLPPSRVFHSPSLANSTLKVTRTSLVARPARPFALSMFRCNTALVRSYASAAITPGTVADPDREARVAKEILKPEPQIVSSTSTIKPIVGEVATEEHDNDPDMMAGVRHDIKVIQETFALQDVPTEAYRVGLAGVLPYLATSTVTVACAMEMNIANHSGSGYGYVLSAESAEALLHVLEPLQIGYGAVIISFLGAVHWGLEWAGYGGYGGYNRYAIGVVAPAIAWPTIFLPVEYALVTQFLAFNILYAVDSHTTVKGWTPPWYSTYRFVLTAVVGASIVITLIGRGQIQEHVAELPSAAKRIKTFQDSLSAGSESNQEGDDLLEEAEEEGEGEE